MARAARKERRTFTLDHDLVGYVQDEARQRSISSLSAALEELLRESKRRREREKIQDAISRYYDSLAEDEREQERDWGACAETQFPRE